MSFESLDRLPKDPAALALRKEARASLDAYEAFLAHPAFVHRIDLSVLAKLATDENVPARERRRAAEVLVKAHLQANRELADLTCVKEQILDQLGIAPGAPPAAVNLTQVNTKIEIVREADWRDAPTSDDRG